MTHTLLDLAKEVIRVAIANPDSMNEGAQYFHVDDTPCCLIGHAMHNLGVRVPGEVNTRAFSYIIADPELREQMRTVGLEIGPHSMSTTAGRFLAWLQPLIDGDPVGNERPRIAWMPACVAATAYAVKTLNEEEASRFASLLAR